MFQNYDEFMKSNPFSMVMNDSGKYFDAAGDAMKAFKEISKSSFNNTQAALLQGNNVFWENANNVLNTSKDCANGDVNSVKKNMSDAFASNMQSLKEMNSALLKGSEDVMKRYVDASNKMFKNVFDNSKKA